MLLVISPEDIERSEGLEAADPFGSYCNSVNGERVND